MVLNISGIDQAEECGEFLKHQKWDVIITSPLQRAKQTAQIINKQILAPVIEMSEFIERSFGDAEGMFPEKRDHLFPNGEYPNQENRQALRERVVCGIQEINQRFKNKRVLLVAHGVVINTILYEFSDGEIGTEKTYLINACISNIELKDNSGKIINFNQVQHLSAFRE